MTEQDDFDAWYRAGEEYDSAGARSPRSRSPRSRDPLSHSLRPGRGVAIGTTPNGSAAGRFLVVAVAMTTATLILGTIGGSLVEARVERAGAEALAAQGLSPNGLVLRARWRTLEVVGSGDSATAGLSTDELALAFADVPIISGTRINLGGPAPGAAARDSSNGSTGEAVALQIQGETVILSGSLASPAAAAEFRRAAQLSLKFEVIDVVGVEAGRSLLETADALAFSRLLTVLEPGINGGLALHSGEISVRLRHPDPAVVQRISELVAALRREGIAISSEVRVA